MQDWMKKYINKKVTFLGKDYKVTDTVSYGGERLLELDGKSPLVYAGRVKIKQEVLTCGNQQ